MSCAALTATASEVNPEWVSLAWDKCIPPTKSPISEDWLTTRHLADHQRTLTPHTAESPPGLLNQPGNHDPLIHPPTNTELIQTYKQSESNEVLLIGLKLEYAF
jgi:hypothetical protein